MCGLKNMPVRMIEFSPIVLYLSTKRVKILLFRQNLSEKNRKKTIRSEFFRSQSGFLMDG